MREARKTRGGRGGGRYEARSLIKDPLKQACESMPRARRFVFLKDKVAQRVGANLLLQLGSEFFRFR
jgi:hypothetical protein